LAIIIAKVVMPAETGIASIPNRGLQEDPGFRACVAIHGSAPLVPVMPAEEAVSQYARKGFGVGRHSGESRNL
jgi:hypothetical protein